MADRLTAAMLAAMQRANPRVRQRLTANLTVTGVGTTDITDRVVGWGEISTEVYGKHPDKPGKFLFCVLTVAVTNEDGAFNYGGTLVPNGIEDFADMTLQVTNEFIESGGSTWVTLDDFTGRVRVPEYDASKVVRLTAEHPLAYMQDRKWTKFDRCGGNTGVRAST